MRWQRGSHAEDDVGVGDERDGEDVGVDGRGGEESSMLMEEKVGTRGS